MRKIVVFFVATADGYYEGPNGEFDWPVVDEEFEEFANDQLREFDTLMFGRRTYEHMAAWWPTDAAKENDQTTTELMNGMPKLAVSRTLASADWAGTTVVDGLEEVKQLKEGPGGDIIIMGSSELCANLLAAGLLDEIRVMHMPVFLGAGRSLLHTLDSRISLDLIATRSFASGNALLCYRAR
jgi:dihydrofolate reductase